MRTIAVLAVLLLCSAAYAQPDKVLAGLAASLQKARAMPVGAPTSFRCPPGLEQLRGLPLSSVLTALSKPDYQNGSEYFYFLSSPIPQGQLGGGHPEIGFYSSAAGNIERVSCSYSR
jgi:hypothetical protein